MITKIPEHLSITYTEINSNVLLINTIEVGYRFRKQGIFKEFLNELSKEFKMIELECFPTLISMYEHLGFEDLGEIDDEGYHLMRKNHD